MSNTNPKIITSEEWCEIAALHEVRAAWGIMDGEPPESFLECAVYGVKFDFQSGGPGYSGDLYILLGDALANPMMLTRVDGKLTVT